SLVCYGYLRRANQVLDRVLGIDPLYPNALNWRALTALAENDLGGAERFGRRAHDGGLSHVGLVLSYVAEARGQRQEAIAQLASGLGALSLDLPPGFAEDTARGTFGDAQARDRALAVTKAHLAARPAVVSGAVPYALMRMGLTEEALAIISRGPTG